MISELRGLEDAFDRRPKKSSLPGRSQNRFECIRTAQKPKSIQIDHFLNRNVHEFCAFPNWRICLPNAFLCGRYDPCDGFTKRRAIQRCEDITGCVAIVGSSARIILRFRSFLILSWAVRHTSYTLRDRLIVRVACPSETRNSGARGA